MSRASHCGVVGVIICMGALACQGEDAVDVVDEMRGEEEAGGYDDGRQVGVEPLEGEPAQVTAADDDAVRRMLESKDFGRTIYDDPPDLSSPPPRGTPLFGEPAVSPGPASQQEPLAGGAADAVTGGDRQGADASGVEDAAADTASVRRPSSPEDTTARSQGGR